MTHRESSHSLSVFTCAIGKSDCGPSSAALTAVSDPSSFSRNEPHHTLRAPPANAYAPQRSPRCDDPVTFHLTLSYFSYFPSLLPIFPLSSIPLDGRLFSPLLSLRGPALRPDCALFVLCVAV
jgi:hypothetical protein